MSWMNSSCCYKRIPCISFYIQHSFTEMLWISKFTWITQEFSPYEFPSNSFHSSTTIDFSFTVLRNVTWFGCDWPIIIKYDLRLIQMRSIWNFIHLNEMTLTWQYSFVLFKRTIAIYIITCIQSSSIIMWHDVCIKECFKH